MEDTMEPSAKRVKLKEEDDKDTLTCNGENHDCVKADETLFPVLKENQAEIKENKSADRQMEDVEMSEKGVQENKGSECRNIETNGVEPTILATAKTATTTDDTPAETCEQKYGMKCFLNQGVRLSGMIKQRHTDFIVRECDPGGNFVQLTDLSHIDDDLIKTEEPMECPLSEEVSEKIKTFAESDDKTQTLILEADNDKEHRKLVHKFIKETYKRIETDTVEVNDGSSSRAVKLFFRSNNNNNNRQRKPEWMKNVPKFCHFVLYKEGRTTMECINTLARMIHSKASCFTYAGTKDRRAATVQRVCVKNVHSKQLSGLNRKLQNMAVGNFSYQDKGLSLGDLSGNKFTIIIRDMVEPDEKIDSTMSSLKEKGFINYFGLQRFGSGDVPTHEIGKVLLQSNFEEAVNLILHLTDDMRFEGQAKSIWHQSKNAKEALKAVKSRSSIEGKILEHLSKQTDKKYNYFNAFQALPRNNRLIYLHSYQSIIWNDVVSKRLQELPHKPCVGDLVLTGEKDAEGHELPTVVTEQNVDQFTIYDIVLPLPGYDVQYPTNEVGQYYQEVISRDGIDLRERHKIKELSLSGAYRHILVKPKDFSWKIKLYDDYTISLVQTDIEKVKPKDGGVVETSVEQGFKYKGVCLEMTLPTSCYATSALREILVFDSSYETQVTLTQNFKEKFKEKYES